jgi:hypothetical protein
MYAYIHSDYPLESDADLRYIIDSSPPARRRPCPQAPWRGRLQPLSQQQAAVEAHRRVYREARRQLQLRSGDLCKEVGPSYWEVSLFFSFSFHIIRYAFGSSSSAVAEYGRRLGVPHGLGNCGITLVATPFSISVASSLVFNTHVRWYWHMSRGDLSHACPKTRSVSLVSIPISTSTLDGTSTN